MFFLENLEAVFIKGFEVKTTKISKAMQILGINQLRNKNEKM